MSKVRVRFAPSPTGPLHIGGVRTDIRQAINAASHPLTDLLLEKEYVYSDLGYYLLKPIIENISNLSLEDYTRFNFYN